MHTIVGVMPAGSQFFTDQDSLHLLGQTEVWIPLVPSDRTKPPITARHVALVARIRTAATISQAQAELDALIHRFKRDHPGTFPTDPRWTGMPLTPLIDEVVRHYRSTLLALQAAAAIILLIACVNVAGLLLARLAARRREVALRSALGAGRFRLMRQFLTEGCLLAVAGGFAGLLLAEWLLQLFAAQIPTNIPSLERIRLDESVLGLTLAVAMLTGILFGSLPSFAHGGIHPNIALKEGKSLSFGGARGRNRFLSSLIVTEFALSAILLVGAGLMLQSLSRLRRVEPGFDPRGVLTLSVEAPERRAVSSEVLRNFYREALDRIKALPGVSAAGAIQELPIQSRLSMRGIRIENGSELRGTTWDIVSADYFRAMRIPLIAGRYFTDQDRDGSTEVVIINETMARRYWGGAHPIGRRLKISGPEAERNPWLTIVGVVGDVRRRGLQSEVRPGVFVPYLQLRPGYYSHGRDWTVVMRTDGDLTALAAMARKEIQAMDREHVVDGILPMEDVVAHSLSAERFRANLLAAGAALALLLAAVGIYGVLTFSVSQQTNEIGIRIALGARPDQLIARKVFAGLAVAAVGIGVGLTAAVALARLMSSFVFGISATDPGTYAGASAVLMLAALLAAYFPARRAAKIDPMVALRCE
jgi:putative ABC transport system permease protein